MVIDLWEQNVDTDMENGSIVVFDLGCTHAHYEMEFGTVSFSKPVGRRFGVRLTARNVVEMSMGVLFNSPMYMRLYQREIEPSEPADE